MEKKTSQTYFWKVSEKKSFWVSPKDWFFQFSDEIIYNLKCCYFNRKSEWVLQFVRFSEKWSQIPFFESFWPMCCCCYRRRCCNRDFNPLKHFKKLWTSSNFRKGMTMMIYQERKPCSCWFLWTFIYRWYTSLDWILIHCKNCIDGNTKIWTEAKK